MGALLARGAATGTPMARGPVLRHDALAGAVVVARASAPVSAGPIRAIGSGSSMYRWSQSSSTASIGPSTNARQMFTFSATRNPPTLAEKLEGWRSFVDGPIEVVELDCDHRHMLLPEVVARIGPALSEQLARAGAITAPTV